MTKKSEITVAERQILDLIKFRSNGKHRFFGNNEYIADCIGIQKTSAKNMVNKLVRLGYLARLMEGKKRYLAYTGKEYEPIVGDLRIDEDEFEKLDQNTLETLAPLYHSTNLNLLAKLIRRNR